MRRERSPDDRGSATTRAKVVLVGKRKAARSAAQRLGLEVLEIDLQPDEEPSHHGDRVDPEKALEAVREVLEDHRPAAALAAAEGAVPTAARIRQAYGLPGLSRTTASLCYDKILMKRAISDAGLPCARWLEVQGGTTADELIDRLGLPLVIKVPVSSGGRGVTLCKTRDDVDQTLVPGRLAEAFIEGVEMSVESLLLAGETLFRNTTRYLEPRWANVVPAGLGPTEQNAVDELVDAVHTALGISHGMSHLELFLTAEGPRFGEVAARPPGGRLMELIQRSYGFDPWESLIEVELGRRPTLSTSALRASGVWFLHPGAGEVARVRGVEAARKLSGVARVRVGVRPGDCVPERRGSGQSVGEVVVEAPDHQTCVDVLRRAKALVSIELSNPSGPPATIR